MRRTFVSSLSLLSAAAAGVLFLQCGGGGGKAVSGVALQETILERRVKGGESLLERIGKGKILDFNQVLVTVDQRLVAQLIEGATPYEQVIDDKYRIRVNSAKVDFRANFALVWAYKDLRYAEAMAGDVESPMLDAALARLAEADAAGFGDRDWTVVNAVAAGQLRRR